MGNDFIFPLRRSKTMKNTGKIIYFLNVLLFVMGFGPSVWAHRSLVGEGEIWQIFSSAERVPVTSIEDSQWRETEITNNPEKPEGHRHIWYRKQISGADSMEHPAIFMDARRLTEIYLDGKLVYQFGLGKPFFPGWEWPFLTLPRKDKITVTIYQYSPTENIGFDVFRFGEKISIINNLNSLELSRFLIGFFVAFSGLLVFIFALLFSREKLLLSFSGSSVTAGLYHISTVHALGNLWFPSPYFWPYLMYASLYFLPVFLLAYLETLIGVGKWKITRVFLLSHFFYAVIALGLIIPGWVHMEDTMGYMQSFLLVTLTVHLVRVIVNIISKRDIEVILLFTGFIAFAVSAFIDLIFARLTASPIHNLSHFSLLFLDFFLILIVVRRYYFMQKKLREYSEDLEEKINDRTRELKTVIEKLEDDLGRAKIIQQKLLPDAVDLPGVRMRYLYLPMGEVGGDFIDIFPLDEHKIRVMIADATGHGIQAALLTMALKTDYEALKRSSLSIDKIMAELNFHFYTKYESLNSFFTAVIMDVDVKSRRYRMVSAGHPIQYYIQNQYHEELAKTGPLVGIKNFAEYQIRPGILHPDSRILLATDGLFEQENTSGKSFMDAKMPGLVAKGSDVTIEEIKKEFVKFKGKMPQQDDITVLLMCFR